MKPSKFRIAAILSAFIVVLAAVVSAAGLFTSLYRDNPLVTAAFRGNDLVTLVLVVPLLIISLVWARNGSKRAQLIWLGSLGYMLYNYVFYMYGTAYNKAFLGYIALVALSIYALILSLSKVEVTEIIREFSPKTPVRWVSGLMLFFVAFMGVMKEITESVAYLFGGALPQTVVDMGNPTAIVFATDLSLLFPAMTIGAILLWRRQPWGYILGTMMMIKGTTYGLALVAMAAFAASATGTWDELTPFYIFVAASSLAATLLLLGNMRPALPQSESPAAGSQAARNI